MREPVATVPAEGLLGDTAARDYSIKLRQFNRFAEPELRRLIEGLHLSPGQRVLDAGCGSGEALLWLQEAIGEHGTVLGIDLADAHVAAARAAAPRAQVQQGDLLTLMVPEANLDLIWCVNTLNHMKDPASVLSRWRPALRPHGRLAVGQSSLLPEMFFAWDARLERMTNEAVRQYYRDRYSLHERDLTAVRGLVGALRRAGFKDVIPRTIVIERVSPLDPATEAYLRETIFRDTWGARLRPYLCSEDFAELSCLCDPEHPRFALRRPDFHFLQSFTLMVAET
jgi:ubiquinone/menaquinone biosynthesis C-methylase UbiE